MSLDWALFRALNGLAGRWPLFDRVVQFLMNDYALTTALSALLVALWFRGQTREERESDQATVVHALVALILASVAVKGLNLLFFRQRPFAVHEVNLIFYHPSDSSLPSNAATVSFVFAVGVLQRSRALGLIGIAVGLLLGLSRVIGGVHYPLDIVAGAVLGSGAVLLVRRYRRALGPLARGVRRLAGLVLLA